MRLPWPFGRAQRSASADGGAGSDGGSAPRPERASGDAWRELPPLSETVGPPPLVAPNRPFAAGLASKEPPAPILKPLSHGRSLEAPRGLVSGIARPTSTVAAPALPAPVQRSPLGGRRASGDDAVAWESLAASPDADPAPDPGTAIAAASVPASASPATAAGAAAGSSAGLGERTLVTAAAPARALTRAPEPARAAPVGLVGQPRASAGGRAGASAAPDSMPGIQRSPAPAAPPSETPSAAPAAAATSATPAATAPTSGGPRLTIGQARRLGLGAPVAGGPITVTTQAFHGGGQAAPAAAAGAAVAEPLRATRTSGPFPPVAMQRAPEPGAPDMPLAAGPAAGAADEPAGEEAGLAMRAVGPGAAPAVAARPIGPAPQRAPIRAGAPIVSAQPLRAGVQRAPLTLPQRAADDAGGGVAALAGPAAATSSGPVKIHRDGDASQLAKALDARSFTHGGEIFLPASHGPLTSGTGKALLAHELTHVAQQRRLGSSLPGEQSPHGRSLESEAVAAERAPDMTLALPQPGPAPAVAPGGTGPAAASAAATTTIHAPGPQRAPAEGASGGTQDAGRGGQRGSAHSHSEQELEVLAHQLYHRIGRHLRRELLVDRERVGFALDLP